MIISTSKITDYVTPEMSDDFEAYRVDVAFEQCREADVRPLLKDLSFVENEQSWGMHFRYSLFEIPETDFQLIRDRMACEKTI